MVNPMEARFVPQEGENISPESAKVISAKIKVGKEKVNVIELDPMFVEMMGNMSFEELEAVAAEAEFLMNKLKGKEAN